ncbi:hexose carrier protein HEX6 [Tanacetum coccineum]
MALIQPSKDLTLGALFLPETPNSLIQHNKDPDKAKKMLQKVQGTNNIQPEFDDLVTANEIAKTIKHPFRNILRQKYRPQLVMAILIPFFQQVTVIDVISFYAPILFKTIGFGESALLMPAVVIGSVDEYLMNDHGVFVELAVAVGPEPITPLNEGTSNQNTTKSIIEGHISALKELLKEPNNRDLIKPMLLDFDDVQDVSDDEIKVNMKGKAKNASECQIMTGTGEPEDHMGLIVGTGESRGMPMPSGVWMFNKPRWLKQEHG